MSVEKEPRRFLTPQHKFIERPEVAQLLEVSGQVRSTPVIAQGKLYNMPNGLKIWTCPQTSRRLDGARRLQGLRFRVNFGAACSANEGGYFLISTFLSASPARTDQFLFKAGVSVALFFANSLLT